MTGALGCLGALIVVGSLIAAYGHDWPAHPMAGHAAIGMPACVIRCLDTEPLIVASLYSFRIHLRRQLLVLVGAHRMGAAERDIPARTAVYGHLDYDVCYVDEQLVRPCALVFFNIHTDLWAR